MLLDAVMQEDEREINYAKLKEQEAQLSLTDRAKLRTRLCAKNSLRRLAVVLDASTCQNLSAYQISSA